MQMKGGRSEFGLVCQSRMGLEKVCGSCGALGLQEAMLKVLGQHEATLDVQFLWGKRPSFNSSFHIGNYQRRLRS